MCVWPILKTFSTIITTVLNIIFVKIFNSIGQYRCDCYRNNPYNTIILTPDQTSLVTCFFFFSIDRKTRSLTGNIPETRARTEHVESESDRGSEYTFITQYRVWHIFSLKYYDPSKANKVLVLQDVIERIIFQQPRLMSTGV